MLRCFSKHACRSTRKLRLYSLSLSFLQKHSLREQSAEQLVVNMSRRASFLALREDGDLCTFRRDVSLNGLRGLGLKEAIDFLNLEPECYVLR